MSSKTLFPVLLYLFILSCKTEKPEKTITFSDVTIEAGINFKYNFGDETYKNIMESSGGGITVFDYNNDGFMDLFFLNGRYLEGISDSTGLKYRNEQNALYKNNGDGTFTDVTVNAGLGGHQWGMAAGAVDIDNDGFRDLYVLNYGPNVFYHNNGNGTFTDITDSLGMRGPEKLNGFEKWSIGVSFWDYNKDKRLDAMVGNFMAFDPKYVNPSAPDMMPSPAEYNGQASMLYEQLPDGKFTDVTEKNGLYFPESRCMGLNILDFDGDGDLDILQANDHQLNYLFRNDDGKFTEIGVSAGIAANCDGVGTGSMHGSPGDIDGDGLIDILITDLSYGALYRYSGNGTFTDVAKTSGIADLMKGKGGWGASLFDYDNDGDQDIISANGTAEELILQPPLLLENDGTGKFTDVGQNHGEYFKTKRSGRGLAIVDFDNDGDPDVVISHVEQPGKPALQRNDGGNRNNWVGLSLTGKNGAVEAIAAKVTATFGGEKHVFINQWTNSYLSNNDPRMLIGLGLNEKIDELEIAWNDGDKEILKDLKPNRYYHILQEKGIETKK